MLLNDRKVFLETVLLLIKLHVSYVTPWLNGGNLLSSVRLYVIRATVSTRGITPRVPLVKAGTRVLVTGGTGFIGSHLVDALIEHGVQPRVLVRPASDIARLARDQADKVELVTGTLEDQHSLTQAVSQVDTVFHLAAVTKACTEEEYLRANAEGTQRLVQAMRAAQPRPRRLIYLSSLAAAGPARDGRPVEPRDEPHPLTAYGRSKLIGEQACCAASDAFGVVMLRAPVVYGPREKDFFLLFRLAARGVLPLPAGPESVVQLVHVTDLVQAMLRAATMPDARGLYHVAESRSYSWSEIATCISRAVGRSVHMVRIPRFLVQMAATVSEGGAAAIGRTTIFNREKVKELLAPGWLCETTLAKQELGFEAQVPLATGCVETAAWYRQQTWL